MRWRILPILLIFSILISPAQAKQRGSHRTQLRDDRTSYYAVIAETGEVLAAQNEDLPLNPASNAKLVTAFCSLETLGPDFRFKTRFFSEGAIQNGEIGNLSILTEGDPSLGNEHLLQIVETLKAQGLKKVRGSIIVDASFFDNNDYPGRKEDNERPYNARTSAASLNHNSAEIFVQGTKQGPIIYLSPNISYFKIQNRLKTGGRRGRVSITSSSSGENEILSVRGRIPRITGSMSFYKSVRNPPEFFAHTFKALLEEAGIIVEGQAKVSPVQGNRLLLTWQSYPLKEIVAMMDKQSNNFIAEQLTKYLGAKKFGPPGTSEKGTDAFKDCLAQIGIDTREIFLENGSGLSYKNRISAKDLVTVIVATLKNPKIRNDFIDSLSLAGVDGTMKRRRTFKELYGILRGKTGSLNAISTLAGVLPLNDGKSLAFAILLNDFRGGHFQAHQIQDGLVLKWLQTAWMKK